VAAAVSGQEGDATALDGPDGEAVARGTEWRLDLDVLDVVEQPVEAGAAEDADLGPAQGTASASSAIELS
jgi:hypothetical protein